MKYAYVLSGVVIEIINAVDDVSIGQQIHPDILPSLIQCDDTVQQGWIYAGKKFSAPPAPIVTDVDLAAYAAGKRFLLETGGFTFNGHPISTDRDSQGKIGNAAVAATVVGSSFSTDWKGADGTFFTLNHDEVLVMATSIMNFISACFATEASILAGIKAGTIKTFADVDVASWPANH